MLILHLSDIHFKSSHVGQPMDPNHHLRNKLLLDAKEMCAKLASAPDVVIISGDIAHAAKQDEYAFAKSWLSDLCGNLNIPLSSVFVVPGNHDVCRDTAGKVVVQSLHDGVKARAKSVEVNDELRRHLSDAEAGELLYKSLANYNAFAGNFLCGLLPPTKTVAIRNLSLNDGSVLRISGLNSTFLSSAKDRKGDLFVDPAALSITDEYGVIHLTVCHHPPEWIRNGTEFESHLDDVALIQLFGHEHTNRILQEHNHRLRIAASAAHPDKREHGWEPGYNLIEVQVVGEGAKRRLETRTHVRIWQSNPGGFIAKSPRQGGAVFFHSADLPEWRAPTPVVSLEKPAHFAVDASPAVAAVLEAEDALTEKARVDPLTSVREVCLHFFELTFSQKSEIAGRLNLLRDEDGNVPDFERSRRVLERALEENRVHELAEAIKLAAQRH
ncbi:3',5'-cyclic adenosine monophosphate phosphodiesterase CpdA [Burkholderia sp. AD24]|nr:3',5'-cyclic adenosine monophosphate phosphodiesterase CpdA [Burkholderia sp. AD24]